MSKPTNKWKLAQWLEIRWWRRYLKTKSPDEYLQWKKGYWKNFLKKLGLSIPASAKILDAGCGPAGIFIQFPENEVMAVDPLLGEYEQLSHFPKGKNKKTQFQKATLEAAHLETYDYVFCLNVINHVSDIEKSMDKICEAVEEDGTLVLSIDAHNWKFFKYALRLLMWDALHPQQYDRKEYEEMLAKRGFEITDRVLVKKEFMFDYWALIAKKEAIQLVD